MKSFKLDDIEKNSHPFSVPEGYFEDLPMRIQSKIQVSKKETWIKSPVFRLAFVVAAMLTIIFAVVFLDQTRTPEEMLADIPEEELLAYVDFMQLDESDIFAAFEGGIEDIDFFDSDSFEDLELEDDLLDDLLIEYDLSDEYL